jgi:hypothetical protein
MTCDKAEKAINGHAAAPKPELVFMFVLIG